MTLTRRISATAVVAAAAVLLAPGVASAAVTCVTAQAVSAAEHQFAPATTRCVPTP